MIWQYFLNIVLIFGFLFFWYAAWVSWRENEPRATRNFFLLSLIPIILGVLNGYFYNQNIEDFGPILLIFILSSISILLFPVDLFRKKLEASKPNVQLDERNVMFSRNTLEPGSDKHRAYYAEFPEHKETDEALAKLPGLLSKDALLYDELSFHAADTNFAVVERFSSMVRDEKLGPKTQKSPEEIGVFLKSWLMENGAEQVGFTKLEDYHLYHTAGRHAEYGQEIKSSHTHAIAITVSMSHKHLQYAPAGPTIMESSYKYVEAGKLAVQCADFLRSLGISARPHIDAHYQVICPLVAADAGLGNIGRMGLLMTPKNGPRVRIAVVTCSLELAADSKRNIRAVDHFCRICKKCAQNCPSKAIDMDGKREILGVKRWQISQEKCFAYWKKIGTDCGRCIAVCPYAHPNNFLHNMVRWGIEMSPIFRHFALRMDHWIYGMHPKSKYQGKAIPWESFSKAKNG